MSGVLVYVGSEINLLKLNLIVSLLLLKIKSRRLGNVAEERQNMLFMLDLLWRLSLADVTQTSFQRAFLRLGKSNNCLLHYKIKLF
jgi:hypothetical protein